MSKSESSALAGSFYPSPPASPRLTTTRDKITAKDELETPKAESRNYKDVSHRAEITTAHELLKEDTTAPTQPAALVALEKAAEAVDQLAKKVQEHEEIFDRLEEKATELILKAWKKALSLDEGQCGAPTQSNQPCRRRIAANKNNEIEESVIRLSQPDQSASAIEAQLDDLAKLVHCYQHDHQPVRWRRMISWLEAMPGSSYTPTVQTRLRRCCPVPIKCISLTKQLRPCKNNVDPADRYFCKKTISKMIQIATGSSSEYDVTLNYLSEVLRYHMLCKTHHTYPPRYHDDWQLLIRNFLLQLQCVYERTQHSTATATLTRKPPRDYWDKGLDTSAFIVLATGDIFNKGMTTSETIYSTALQRLDTTARKAENEINRGYVYVYTVPGNTGFFKIGFTTREGDARHEEWKKACHRDSTTVYRSDEIPHARRVEKLVHADLAQQRARIDCERCEKQHIEWFRTLKHVAIASVKKWTFWIEGAPYEEKGSEWALKNVEAKKLEDMESFLKGLTDATEATGDAKQTAKPTAVDGEKQ